MASTPGLAYIAGETLPPELDLTLLVHKQDTITRSFGTAGDVYRGSRHDTMQDVRGSKGTDSRPLNLLR